MDTFYPEKNCISLSHMADPTFTAFDGGTAKGAAPASPACASSKEGDGAYPSGAVTVLGSNLWNKTIPYDPDLKVALEFMDLEEFLNENNIPLNDSNRLSNFSEEKSSVDDNRKCSRLSTPGADVSCSFASLTTPVRCSSASTSPVHPALQTPPSCSPSSLHDSNSSSYHLPLQSDLSFMNANSQLLFEDSNDVEDCCNMLPERRSRSPENFNSLSPPSLLQSTNINAKTNERSVNSTSNSASEGPSTSSSHIFMKTPEFPNFGEYSVDFHGVTADQSSSGGENPPVMDIGKRSQDSNSEPHGKIGGSSVAEMSPDSWESSSHPPCDTTCSSTTPDVTHDRGRRKNHGRGQAAPSVGVRNRRRRGVASYAEIDDDIISDLCDFTKDEPQQVDERIAPAQRNPATKTGEKFNPRTRKFSEHELKPQPMVKKSRKQYVPPDLKDDKYWARRQKNNVAAKRSRDARRVKENQIALRASYLEEMHAKLKRQLDEANEIINALKERLSKYEAV